MLSGKMTRFSPAAAVSYAFDEAPGPGSCIAVAPGVLWLRMPLPFALDHINLWLLEDGDGFTIVDTGIARDEVKSAWQALFSGFMDHRPVKRLICTHFHPDHFGLAGWLTEVLNVPLWMTRSEWLTGCMLYGDIDGRVASAQVALFEGHGLDNDRLQTMARRGNTYRRVVAAPPASYRRIADGDRLEIDGCEWRVIIGRGHAPEHACLYCADKGVLISGDQILPKISPNVSLSAIEPDADPLNEYLQSLKPFSALPEDTLVLPSHNFPFYGLHERIRALTAHHEERLDRLAEFCLSPRTAAETLKVLFRRELDAHQIMFAMGESLSHLVYLEGKGRLQRSLDGDGIVRFAQPGAET